MGYKLIVADNSPSIQKAVQLAFPKTEFEVFPFGDGVEVIKNLGQINPDAILLSLTLPGKDGYEIGYYLKSQEDFRRTALIFLQGAFESFDQKKMAALDYDVIIRKPFDSGKLARLVKNIIENKRNPLTLPEEPPLGEMSSRDDEKVRIEEKEETSQRALELIEDEVIKKQIQDFIVHQLSEIKKEMEERVRSYIIQEMKEQFQKELDALRIELLKLKDQK
ncbi:MAG: response regulator [Candidatus Aminicenantaceae bacterium]